MRRLHPFTVKKIAVLIEFAEMHKNQTLITLDAREFCDMVEVLQRTVMSLDAISKYPARSDFSKAKQAADALEMIGYIENRNFTELKKVAA